jgi:hypothetical protein
MYCSSDDVSAQLGGSLTTLQAQHVSSSIQAASGWVESYCNRVWNGSTVTGEQHVVTGDRIWLRQTPVDEITTVTVRAPTISGSERTLTDGTDYRLTQAALGAVLVSATCGDLLTVTYTVVADVPEEVKTATAMLAASWLPSSGSAASLSGVSSVQVGQLRVQYGDADANQSSVPDPVYRLLAGQRRLVIA